MFCNSKLCWILCFISWGLRVIKHLLHKHKSLHSDPRTHATHEAATLVPWELETGNLQGVVDWQLNSMFRAGQICLWFQRAFIIVICPVSQHRLLGVQGEHLIKIHPKGCQVMWSSMNLHASQEWKEQTSYESLRSLCRPWEKERI